MSDTSWQDGIVRAGATQPAYIAEVRGLHPALFFKFRVKNPEVCEALIKKVTQAKDGPEAIRIMQETVKESITHWSFKDDVGSPLTHPLLKKVFWIAIHNEPSDPIPEEFEKVDTVDEAAKK